MRTKTKWFQLHGQQWNTGTTSKSPSSCSLWQTTYKKKATTWPQLEQKPFIALLTERTPVFCTKETFSTLKWPHTPFSLFVTNTEQIYKLLLNNSPMHVIAILLRSDSQLVCLWKGNPIVYFTLLFTKPKLFFSPVMLLRLLLYFNPSPLYCM